MRLLLYITHTITLEMEQQDVFYEGSEYIETARNSFSIVAILKL